MNSPNRPTQSYLKALLQERGLRPRNKLGQNFLVDLNLMDVIIEHAELSHDDLVLEIGTGTGGLSERLAERAGAVLSVEIDRDLHEVAKERFGHLSHLKFIQADILHGKNHLHPEVLAALKNGWQTGQFKNIKLIANLPYAVATPAISNLLLSPFPIERMVVTVQWEIAERFMGLPGTADYGALTVLMQTLADVELVRKLPPSVFWPKPAVDSAIVRIKPSAERKASFADPQEFRYFLRDLYTHRRKNLRGALAALPALFRDKAKVDSLLESLQISGSSRAEDLDLASHRRLFDAVMQMPPST